MYDVGVKKFTFAISSADEFLVIRIGYRISDVAKNLDRYVSCTERTAQRKDFELILKVKMETRHGVEGQFGSEFPAICNHCGVMAA